MGLKGANLVFEACVVAERTVEEKLAGPGRSSFRSPFTSRVGM